MVFRQYIGWIWKKDLGYVYCHDHSESNERTETGDVQDLLLDLQTHPARRCLKGGVTMTFIKYIICAILSWLFPYDQRQVIVKSNVVDIKEWQTAKQRETEDFYGGNDGVH